MLSFLFWRLVTNSVKTAHIQSFVSERSFQSVPLLKCVVLSKLLHLSSCFCWAGFWLQILHYRPHRKILWDPYVCVPACWWVCKYWFLEIHLPRPLQSLTVMATERLILVNYHWTKYWFMYKKCTLDLCMRTRKDSETLENGKCFTKAALALHSQMFMFWLIYIGELGTMMKKLGQELEIDQIKVHQRCLNKLCFQRERKNFRHFFRKW